MLKTLDTFPVQNCSMSKSIGSGAASSCCILICEKLDFKNMAKFFNWVSFKSLCLKGRFFMIWSQMYLATCVIMRNSCFWITPADEHNMISLLQVPENRSLLCESGFIKPLINCCIEDKQGIIKAVFLHLTIFWCLGEWEQLRNGPNVLGVCKKNGCKSSSIWRVFYNQE